MSENNLFNINVGTLIGIFINNQIDNNAVIMTDSGWECDETEVNMVYYNAKTNVIMLTRKYGNYETYEDSDDWKLLWFHPDLVKEERND